MKRQAAMAGVLASAIVTAAAAVTLVITTAAFADVRVTRDLGGEVSSYIHKFETIRDSGERLVIDGPCLSACTLFTALVPRDQVCVTRRAVLGFHAATLYDSARRTLVPTRKGTSLVIQLYPPEIRDWIARHGGLTPTIIMMRGRDLAALFKTCQ
jgi:hypothetical protein